MLFRFVTAPGAGGEYSAVTSAIAEFTPARSRGRSNGVVMSFWAIGGILTSLVSILSTFGLSWRYTMLFGVSSAGYGLGARRLISESPRWLAAKGRLDEAIGSSPRSRASRARTETSSRCRRAIPPLPRSASCLVDHKPKLFCGMALDCAEAAGSYVLFTATSIFVFCSATGAVPISDSALPYHFLTAKIDAFFGGVLFCGRSTLLGGGTR